jgi:serine/threonine protein kinase
LLNLDPIATTGRHKHHATLADRPLPGIQATPTFSDPNSNLSPSPPRSQYRTGKTLGSGTYAIVKEAVHIKTGTYYACKVINKKLMEGREHMVDSFL